MSTTSTKAKVRKPLFRFKIGETELRVTAVEPILGDARVEGWGCSPTKDEGFAACGVLAKALGRSGIGGWIDGGKGPIHFPFIYDVPPEYVSRRGRKEDREEVVQRALSELRKAQVKIKKIEAANVTHHDGNR